MSMWGDDPGGSDVSHLYLGLAMGAANRANRAEDESDKLFAAIGNAHASQIAWQAIAIAYRQLCEAMLDELASSATQKDLNSAAHPHARNLFLRAAVERQISHATKYYQDTGHAKKWPDVLGKARSKARSTVFDMIFKMEMHAEGHFRDERRRAGSPGKSRR